MAFKDVVKPIAGAFKWLYTGNRAWVSVPASLLAAGTAIYSAWPEPEHAYLITETEPSLNFFSDPTHFKLIDINVTCEGKYESRKNSPKYYIHVSGINEATGRKQQVSIETSKEAVEMLHKLLEDGSKNLKDLVQKGGYFRKTQDGGWSIGRIVDSLSEDRLQNTK